MVKDNSNANGDGTSADVHLVLNGKGGVGKSLVATWLAEFLVSRGRSVRSIDGGFSEPVIQSIQSSWSRETRPGERRRSDSAGYSARSRAADFLFALERDRSIASEMLKAGLGARPEAFGRATAILEPGRKERDKGTAPAVARSSGKMTLRKKQGAGPMTLISVNHCLRRMKSAFSERPPYLD